MNLNLNKLRDLLNFTLCIYSRETKNTWKHNWSNSIDIVIKQLLNSIDMLENYHCYKFLYICCS